MKVRVRISPQPPSLWLSASECDPPHRADPQKSDAILQSLYENGWQGQRLIGYRLNNRIQLLSGSHRWDACRRLGRKMPVRLVPYSQVYRTWGDVEAWKKMMSITGNLV